MATDENAIPVGMSNEGIVIFSPNRTHLIQAGQGVSAAVIDSSGVVHYIASPSNPPQEEHQVGICEKLLNVDTKTLGYFQIIIGVIHIALGAISADLAVSFTEYTSMSIKAGYPFWGAVLVKWSAVMNFLSAEGALVGTALYITELIQNSKFIGASICILLLFFSLVEFCIAVSMTFFGCQETSKKKKKKQSNLPASKKENT
ncbi:membrane-spanning 4-domains subfamily A member 8-like isoform X2 [Hemicordylus capensis]|uniref:membrane-spanning 4-domains subfamily A member 8-like isoform X2 n=1 Tax=Hemicordylus capensis TaxID=884348 RepID=UPI0023043205|nr:membrane-spanning 4-domains subfamily A member 8-like isoform X2 [Hemicordylus capensis]